MIGATERVGMTQVGNGRPKVAFPEETNPPHSCESQHVTVGSDGGKVRRPFFFIAYATAMISTISNRGQSSSNLSLYGTDKLRWNTVLF